MHQVIENLERLLEPVKVATMLTDCQMNVIYMNPAAETITGLECQIGEDVETMPLELSIVGSPSPDIFDAYINTESGYREIRLSVSPLTDDEELVGFLVRMADKDSYELGPCSLN